VNSQGEERTVGPPGPKLRGQGPHPRQGAAQEEGPVVPQGQDHAEAQGQARAPPVAKGHGRRQQHQDQVGQGQLGVKLQPGPVPLQGGRKESLAMTPRRPWLLKPIGALMGESINPLPPEEGKG
jgi:hypothetical protein